MFGCQWHRIQVSLGSITYECVSTQRLWSCWRWHKAAGSTRTVDGHQDSSSCICKAGWSQGEELCVLWRAVGEAELCAPFRAQKIVSESQILGNELFILVDFLFGCDWF